MWNGIRGGGEGRAGAADAAAAAAAGGGGAGGGGGGGGAVDTDVGESFFFARDLNNIILELILMFRWLMD